MFFSKNSDIFSWRTDSIYVNILKLLFCKSKQFWVVTRKRIETDGYTTNKV